MIDAAYRATGELGSFDTLQSVSEVHTPETSTAPLDVAAIRADFPILHASENGRRIAYLDSASSAQRPTSVIRTLDDIFEHAYANVHRGVYRWSEAATNRYEGTRLVVRDFLNARSAGEIVFTRNTTEAVNLVAQAWGRANLNAGDVVACTELEHHSNFVPWQQIALERGAEFRVIPIDGQATLQLDALDEIAAAGPIKVLAVGHVSNTFGTVNPVRTLVDWAHAQGAIAVIDGAQAAPHRAVDVQQLGCDFYAFSGHKLMGPSGAGVLWGREELLDALPPFMTGGGMIERVSVERTTFAGAPWKFEAGTPAIAEVIAMGEAIRYLQDVGLDRVHAHEQQLTAYAVQQLRQIEGVTLHGPIDDPDHAGILSFTCEGIHPHDMASLLDGQDVAVRAGHHCTQPAMQRLKLTATSRASFYLYNDREDVDALVAGIEHAQRVFAGGL